MGSLSTQVPLHLSRFTHFVKVGGNTTAIYNALSQDVVYVPSAVASAIGDIQDATVDQFLERHFPNGGTAAYDLLQRLWSLRILVGQGEDEMSEVQTLQQVLETPQIMILYLILTDICNIRCKYCFFEGGIPEGYTFSKMSLETAKRGIDLFAESLDPAFMEDDSSRPMIILYGGEALLNWSVAEWVLEYIEQQKALGVLPAHTGVTLNTNGILLTPRRAAILAKHNVNVAISVDGPKEVHDKMRVDRKQRGTFDRVMRGFNAARAAGCNLSVCCTIDDHNLEILPEITTWIVEELGVQGFGFNTLLECNARRIPRPVPYSQAVAKALVESFQIAREYGVHEDRFMRKVNAFAEGTFYFSDCGGCGMQLVISPDGYVGTCHAYCGTHEYFVPLDEITDPVSHPYWLEWRKRSPINMAECYNCIALANCGGGCPHSAAIATGSIWEKDESFCPHAQEAVRFLIKDLYRLKADQES